MPREYLQTIFITTIWVLQQPVHTVEQKALTKTNLWLL